MTWPQAPVLIEGTVEKKNVSESCREAFSFCRTMQQLKMSDFKNLVVHSIDHPPYSPDLESIHLKMDLKRREFSNNLKVTVITKQYFND